MNRLSFRLSAVYLRLGTEATRTDRPVPTAYSAAKLAAWVDSAYAKADSLLFTVTPREELDAIGRFQQLKDQAFAGQVRAIVAAYNLATVSEREFARDEGEFAGRAVRCVQVGVRPTRGPWNRGAARASTR